MDGDGSFWSSIPAILTAVAGVIAAVGSLAAVLIKGKREARAKVASAEAAAPAGEGLGGSAESGASARAGGAPAARDGTSPAAPAAVTLRSAPAVLSPAKVEAMLVRLGCYEKRRNPAGKGFAHRYAARAIGDAVVVEDGATGLTWQKVASSEPMTIERAAAYVDDLNGRRFAGFTDWRLPTAEEAMSLMEPRPTDDFHIAPALGRGGNFVWTADRPPDGGGWVVYFYDAILAVESEAFNAWVRAVR